MANAYKISKLRRPVLVAILGTLFTSLSHGGTYSIVKVDWNPTGSPGVGTNGGYIRFGTATGSNLLDVEYGLSSALHVPYGLPNGMNPPIMVTSDSSIPTVMGKYRWKIRWVGAAGEAHPLSVSATVQHKGYATTHATAMSFTYPAGSQAQISDPYFTCFNSAGSSPVYPGQLAGAPDQSSSGTFTEVTGAATWTHVDGTVNTWIGYVNGVVDSGASLSAFCGVNGYSPASVADCSASLAVTNRLTQIDGQRLQPDL